MNNLPESRQVLWLEIIQKIQEEWRILGEVDRAWIASQVERLTDVQQQLHNLVSAADGEDICCDCGGACCGHGLYHPTLVTILAHLVFNHPLPVPDFNQSCPYLGVTGCSFSPVVRPYNCLTFICDLIECHVSEEQRQTVLTLELELRGIYESFDNRYSGSSLRGLMNRIAGEDFPAFLNRRDVLN